MVHSSAALVAPGLFNAQHHWYDKASNAPLHPLVQHFMSLSSAQLISRYCHLHPMTNKAELEALLRYEPRYLAWSGADLFHATFASGERQMVVVEVNSCPSGQKSMPLLVESEEQGGYRRLLEQTFLPRLHAKRKLPSGGLAVLYDKNEMENVGYARVLADLCDEPVHLVYCGERDWGEVMTWKDRTLFVRDAAMRWQPIRAAFRYVTQRPWTRILLNTKTFIFNPIISCLAGGRNKALAAKAYDLFNAELSASRLKIVTPYTIWDVTKEEIPLWVRRLGGHAVVKSPYSNAGQGVFTVVNARELDAFMEQDFPYERFIVQSLIGNYEWSSRTSEGRLYHIGTVPDRRGDIYAADLRLMVHATGHGFRPLAMYARRAALPLADTLQESDDSWQMLGTNLSGRSSEGEWVTDTTRLVLMDRRDFNRLGLGLDDLIDAFIQTVLATIAIDRLAISLIGERGDLRVKLFQSLNNDRGLHDEILG